MKLIIDIPDTMIQELKDGCFGVKHNVYELAGCIMNGIPLEDIKTEIQKALDEDNATDTENAKVQAIALMWCLEVIERRLKNV